MEQIVGIDYGSKLAGTTVIAYLHNGQVCFDAVRKKADADQFILDWATSHQPTTIFLDAPLSLPGVYRWPDHYDDFFYRAADRSVGAMSPMFLGGLTARAMRLRQQLSQSGITVQETYPARLANRLELDKQRYKKDRTYMASALSTVAATLPSGTFLPTDLPTWHHFDALLALASGYRYLDGTAEQYGTEEEGMIVY